MCLQAVSIGTEYEYDPEGEELTANRILTDSELLQPGSQGRFLDVCSAGSHG